MMLNWQVVTNPMSLHIVLAVLFAIGIHTCEEKRFWKVSNTITSACDLWKGAVPNVLTCAQMCRRQDTCVMFRFHVTGSCSTFCDTGSDSGATSEYEDTVYTTNTSNLKISLSIFVLFLSDIVWLSGTKYLAML